MSKTTTINLRVGRKLADAIEAAAYAHDVPPATFCKFVLASYDGRKPPRDPNETRDQRLAIKLRSDIAQRLTTGAEQHDCSPSALLRGLLSKAAKKHQS